MNAPCTTAEPACWFLQLAVNSVVGGLWGTVGMEQFTVQSLNEIKIDRIQTVFVYGLNVEPPI